MERYDLLESLSVKFAQKKKPCRLRATQRNLTASTQPLWWDQQMATQNVP